MRNRNRLSDLGQYVEDLALALSEKAKKKNLKININKAPKDRRRLTIRKGLPRGTSHSFYEDELPESSPVFGKEKEKKKKFIDFEKVLVEQTQKCWV